MSVNKLHVTGWSMSGSHYKQGVKNSGFTLLQISDGTTRYYPESVAIGPTLDRVQVEYGIDTTEAKAKLDHWVKTGEGATFDLKA